MKLLFEGKLGSGESLFFYDNTTKMQSQLNSYSQPYTPSFLDVLIAQNLTNLNAIKAACQNDYACMSDSLLTGFLQFGLDTKNTVNQQNLINSIQCKIVSFNLK